MIKKISALTIILATILVVFASCGGIEKTDSPPPSGLEESPASDFVYRYEASVNGIEIKGYIGNSMRVHIPEKIDGESVTGIGRRAFQDSNIVEIYIPNTVKNIDALAFTRCLELTNITIPNSVLRIGYGAFFGCTGLSSVTISDRVTRIGYGTFSRCTGLTNIIIPDSVTQIGGDAFSYCTRLADVTIPDSVTQIGAWAFTGCLGLTNIAIPDSVRQIEIEVFSHCTALTNANYKGIAYDLSVKAGWNELYLAVNGEN